MKTIFFCSSHYCLPILGSLSNNFQLIAIVTKQNSAVQQYAKENNIKVFTPKDKEELINLKNDISSLTPDLAIVADYGLLIPKEIFSIPHYQTLNIHFSKLPYFRGPSPVQYTILMGEKSAWISVIIMDEEMDTGDIIWQKEVKLMNNGTMEQWNNETTGSLYQKLFNITARELPDIINKYINNDLIPQKQDHSSATYTKHLSREYGFIPPQLLDIAIKGSNPSKELLNQWSLYKSLPCQLFTFHFSLFTEHAVRALSPWPGLWTEIIIAKDTKDTSDGGEATTSTPPRWRDQNKKRLKILNAHLKPLASQGRPLRGYQLVLDLVQLEGKKPVSWKQFQEGYPEAKFEVQP